MRPFSDPVKKLGCGATYLTAENITYEISRANYSNAPRQMLCYRTGQTDSKISTRFSQLYTVIFRIFYPHTHLSKKNRIFSTNRPVIQLVHTQIYGARGGEVA